MQRKSCMQCHARTIRAVRNETDGALIPLRLVAGAGVVESRCTMHLKAHLPFDDAQGADDVVTVSLLVLVFVLDYRHEVGDFGDARLREKARKQNIRIRQIELLDTHIFKIGIQSERTSAFAVEKSRENGRRIEIGETEEIN